MKRSQDQTWSSVRWKTRAGGISKCSISATFMNRSRSACNCKHRRKYRARIKRGEKLRQYWKLPMSRWALGPIEAPLNSQARTYQCSEPTAKRLECQHPARGAKPTQDLRENGLRGETLWHRDSSHCSVVNRVAMGCWLTRLEGFLDCRALLTGVRRADNAGTTP